MKIPCKDCLVFPACRNKQKIICNKLCNFIHHSTTDKISWLFPEWTEISNEDRSFWVSRKKVYKENGKDINYEDPL